MVVGAAPDLHHRGAVNPSRWQRWLTLLVPERELDPGARAEFDREARELNLARVRSWWAVLVGSQALVMWFTSRVPVSTPAALLWRRDLLWIYAGLELVDVVVIGSVFVARGPARAVAARVGPIFQAAALTGYALMGVNAQRLHGAVGPYLAVLVAVPYVFRAPTAWYYAMVAASSALLMAGIARVQPSPALRLANINTLLGFTVFGVVIARMYVAAVVNDLRNRRALRQLNGELESRVEAQTRELRGFATRLDEVLEAERRRLARDLHDDLGQELTAMRFEVETLRAYASDEGQRAGLGRVSAAIDRSHQGVRVILESLRPRILDEEGLEAAVAWLARQFRERTGRVCEVTVALAGEPDAAVGLVVFRVVQEALTNVARHADAARVAITLRVEGGRLALTVEDDGRGLPAERTEGRHGLVGMRERVAAAGGELVIERVEPRGTRVRAFVPAG